MRNKSFSFGEVLGFGWRTMKDNLGFFVGVFIILFLISLLGQILGYVIQQYPENILPLLGLLLVPVILIIEIILSVGLIKIALSFCDDRKPRLSMLFDAWGCFWRCLGAGLLYGLIVMLPPSACILLPMFSPDAMNMPYVSMCFFIMACILMIALSIKFSLCFYFVVDKGLGPINALKASSRTTMNAKGALFFFGILCGLINLLGALCFGIGLFATVPTVMVAMALVYRQLSAQTPGLEDFGISIPVIQVSPSMLSGLSIRLRPDSGVQPVAGVQSIPHNQAPSGKENATRIPSVAGIEHFIGEQPGTGTQPDSSPQPDSGIQHAPRVRPVAVKKKSNSLMLVVLLAAAVIVAGFAYYHLRPATTKAVPTEKNVALTGILYAGDNSSAVVDGKIVHEGDTINGVKVIKIHEHEVEFARDGKTWTQRVE